MLDGLRVATPQDLPYEALQSYGHLLRIFLFEVEDTRIEAKLSLDGRYAETLHEGCRSVAKRLHEGKTTVG